MKYISTRGGVEPKSFEDVVLTGLAEDGGLFVPEQLPKFSIEEIASWSVLSYEELALKIITPFVGGSIPEQDLRQLIEKSYAGFRHEAVAPLIQAGHNQWILELFQGPTLAFKDFALQFLGNLLDYILAKRDQKVVIMGATSGDTGSAAIEGCRHCKNLDIFILHPYERVSEVQRRQMTTVLADNIHNLALHGDFDDCQNMVKASFADQSFLPEDRQLAAVNSINWARIMAQIVYYFWASLALGGPHKKVSFSVPTGNFGDIFAGYLASQMGLPIEQLVIATNQNDILHRCISENDHSTQPLQQSLAPSMDIMISSNFERLLFDLYDRDGEQIAKLMADAKNGHMKLSDTALAKARKLFSSYRCGDQGMVDVIRSTFDDSGYLLDPHTAIGLAAARACSNNKSTPMITLATAHPAKFPDAVKEAGYPEDPALPPHMADLFEREEQYTVLDNDSQVVQQFIAEHITS
ncbi:MAG: threonine synthase [Porticoccaceae bacterium]|nr:threonine synthase [Porticoccaceae bacterium]